MPDKQYSGVPGSFLAIIFLAVAALPAQAADTPEQLLARMQIAVEQTNYEGTLVHMSAGRVDQFRIYQRVAAEGVTERTVLVDGAGAEIIRTPDEVICIFPEQSSVVIEDRASAAAGQSPLRAGVPSIEDVAPEYYRLSMRNAGRVAERESIVVAIQPQDEFRYGYRLWLDSETAMPLKSQMLGNDESMPIEEIRFVSISMPVIVDAELVQPGIDTSRYRVERHRKAAHEETENGRPVGWFAQDLPPGFMLTSSHFEYMEGASTPRRHLVYTDGLASVSVFVDAAGREDETEGFSSMGAASAYSLVKDGLYVTAMGEVPPATVRRIAMSMSPAD